MTEPSVTTVCHVRAPLLLEPVDRQVETLRACAAEGTIDDLLLRSWPQEIALTDNSPYQEALESFERFDEWATQQGVSIRPPFTKRETTSQLSGKTTERLVMPLACLEVYVDDELVGVFPHTDEELEETYTTDEAIATLRTGEVPTPLGSVDAVPTPRDSTDGAEATRESVASNACPDCGGPVVDGQGLFACGGCGWVGTVSETGQYESWSEQPLKARTAQSVNQ